MKKIEEHVVSFETAKLAKAKGFDLPTYYAYDLLGNLSNDEIWNYSCEGGMSLSDWLHCFNVDCYDDWEISAPTQSLLQKWLRERLDVHIAVVYNSIDEGVYLCSVNCNKVVWCYGETYEEALEKGIYEALNLISL